MGNMDRRTVLKLSGLALASSVAGCISGGGGGSSGDFTPMDMTADDFKNPSNVDYEDTFNMWNWYDGFAKYTKSQFPKAFENLQRVTTSGYSSATQWYSKLQAGNYDMDNIGGTTLYTARAIENDLLSPIPVDEMPNWQYIPKETKDNFNKYFTKNGNMYAVPETRGLGPVLGYNGNVFDESPSSWGILWDEEYKGKLTMMNNAIEACEIAALYTGQDPFDPDDYKEIKEALLQQKPLIKTYWKEFSAAMRLFLNETVVAGALTRGRLFAAHFGHNAPYVQYTVPEEGVFMFSNHYLIPSNSPHPKISTLFCNWAIHPQNAIQHFLTMGYLPPLENLAGALKEAGVPQEKIDFVTVEDNSKLIFIPPIKDAVRNKYSQIWTEVLAA